MVPEQNLCSGGWGWIRAPHRKIKTQILVQSNPETKGKKEYIWSTFSDLFQTSFRRFLIILV